MSNQSLDVLAKARRELSNMDASPSPSASQLASIAGAIAAMDGVAGDVLSGDIIAIDDYECPECLRLEDVIADFLPIPALLERDMDALSLLFVAALAGDVGGAQDSVKLLALGCALDSPLLAAINAARITVRKAGHAA